MFDVGFWELALIFVVALVVVGPERMPGLIRTTGQWLGRMQRVARELRAEFEREAHTQEFKALNAEFLEEDRRLKELARNPLGAPTSRAEALEQAGAAPAAAGEATAAESIEPPAAPAVTAAPGPSATKTGAPV